MKMLQMDIMYMQIGTIFDGKIMSSWERAVNETYLKNRDMDQNGIHKHITLRLQFHYTLLIIQNGKFLFSIVLMIFQEVYVQNISVFILSWSVWFKFLNCYVMIS